MHTVEYQLHFRSPFRVGERGVGLESTRTNIPADTLFSAVCSAWRMLFGVESLLTELLEPFLQDPACPPFLLSSAFPFAGDIRLFPKPLGIRPRIDEASEKTFKGVRFVSESLFLKLADGENLSFEGTDCANSDQVWLTKDEKKTLARSFTDDNTGSLSFWRTFIVPRVTLDRMTNASQIWHLGLVQFMKECGLWFTVRFHQDNMKDKFESCLRILEDSGLGGERGAGYGLFNLKHREFNLSSLEETNHFVSLSPVCPRNEEEAVSLMGKGANYELIPKRGWIGSPEGGNLRRKQVWMLSEGSLLMGNPNNNYGAVVDVKPDVSNLHSVWRYGLAYPVGVNSNE